MKRTKGFIYSFLLGGAIGSVIALLYAPSSGKKLRKDIGRKTNDLIEDGKRITSDSWDGVKQTAENTYENAGDFLNSSMKKIARKSEKVKDSLKSVFEK